MAIYKNREVQITSYITDESPVVEIQHKDGSREMVKLREVQFTEDEKKHYADHEDTPANSVNVIKDKDLKDLRDSQDRKKIEENKKNNPQKNIVPVSKISVDANEVQKNRSK